MSNKSNRYTDEFKKQIVKLHNNNKSSIEIVDEYDLTLFDKVRKEERNQGKLVDCNDPRAYCKSL